MPFFLLTNMYFADNMLYMRKRVRIKDVIELFAKIATIILAIATIYQCVKGGL